MSDKNISNDEEKVIILDDEKTLVLDHDYDGIKELNHPLPFWWTWLFILTVVFSIPYYYYYHMSDGPSLQKELEVKMTEVNSLREAAMEKQGGFDEEAYNSFIASGESDRLGAKTYKRRCQSCHGRAGEGGIGPNLTDKFWIYGNGSASSVYKAIDKGIESNGMPAWGELLEKEALFSVTNHVMKLIGTNPENAKAPQGTEY